MEFTTGDIDRAAAQFTQEKQRLYRGDGNPVYGPEEHEVRVDALLATFDRTGEAAVEQADTAIKQAEQTLYLLEHSDPVDRLSEADLARANARAIFVREDAE